MVTEYKFRVIYTKEERETNRRLMEKAKKKYEEEKKIK